MKRVKLHLPIEHRTSQIIPSVKVPNVINEGFWSFDSPVLQRFFLAYIHKIEQMEFYGVDEENNIEIYPEELVEQYQLFSSTAYFLKRKDQLIIDMKKARIDYYPTEKGIKLQETSSLSVFPSATWSKQKRCFVIRPHVDLWKEVQNELQRYTLHVLLDAMRLKSKFSIRLYGLLLQYKNMNDYETITELSRKFDYFDLRKYLLVPDNSYLEFRGFNQNILKKMINGINEKDLPIHNVRCEISKPGKFAKKRELKFIFDYDDSKSIFSKDNELKISTSLLKTQDDILRFLFKRCSETNQMLSAEDIEFKFKRLKNVYSISEFNQMRDLDGLQLNKVLENYSQTYDLEALLENKIILKS